MARLELARLRLRTELLRPALHSRSSWWTCRKSNPRSLLAREARCPQHKPKSGTSARTRTSTLTLRRRSSSLLSYGGKNGGSWMESNLVPGRDLVYSQTSGHRSLFAQPIDWYPMSGLNRLQQVCRTRHRPNGSGKYMLHARYLHRAPLGYTYPVVAVTSCRSPHEGLFGASNEIRTRRSPDRQSGSTPGVEALKWLPPLESNQTLTR